VGPAGGAGEEGRIKAGADVLVRIEERSLAPFTVLDVCKRRW